MKLINVAGYSQDEITAEVIGKTLHIEAKNEEYGERYHCSYIGDHVPKIVYKNGLLEITLDKPKGKKITIEG